MGANLTITSIKVEDLDRKFMCLLSTPQVIEGETKLIVHLEHRQLNDEGNENINVLPTGQFSMLFCRLLIFFQIQYFLKNSFRNTIKSVIQFGSRFYLRENFYIHIVYLVKARMEDIR